MANKPIKPSAETVQAVRAQKSALTRAGNTAGSAGQIVRSANRWRESYNPLRNLTIRRAVELLERGQLGDYADLQWTYRFIEMTNPTLLALVTRCESPLLKFDWEIKTVEKIPPGMNESQFQAMAKKQEETLRAKYDFIDNLKQAICHLALADFRGFAIVQKHFIDGDVRHLEVLDQWKWIRDGLFGDWYWNPTAQSNSSPAASLGKENRLGGGLPREEFIIRECERPIDRIALINFIRRNLVEKDWDAFLEIYGIPGGVVTMPTNVPQGKESEYETTAKQIAEGGSGAIPGGSTYTPNDSPRGVDPFSPRRKALDEDLILAGTGGKLTMLAESGSGTLAGGAHEETFNEIAQGRAAQISECFQKQFDAVELNTAHPGEPHVVYFELCAEEKKDVASLVTNISTLKSAGYTSKREWVEEQTGVQLEEEEPESVPPPQPGFGKFGPAQAKFFNRETPELAVAAGIQADLKPALDRLDAILKIQDPQIFEAKLRAFVQEFPQLAADIVADPAAARSIQPILQKAFTA